MPNWCKGKLKVRGNPENIVRWFTDCVTVYDRPYFNKNKFPNGEWVYNKIHDGALLSCDDETFYINVKDTAYIEGTMKNFVEKFYTEQISDGDNAILVLPVMAAWSMQPEPYEEMSKKYRLDFRFYGFESSGCVNQEMEVIKGETTINREIRFDDYRWECVDPLMGG